MKILKKITSLTMSAILLFTTNSALQATGVVDLDKAEIQELRESLAKDVKNGKYYPGIPNVNVMINRYNQSVKNYKDNLKELDKSLEGRDAKDIKKHLNQLKKVAEYTAKHDERYLVVPEPDRQMAAFNTLLYMGDDMMILMILGYVFIAGGFLSALGFLMTKGSSSHAHESSDGFLGCSIAFAAAIIVVAIFLIALLTASYVPVISPSFDEEKTLQMFTEKPFEYLADFKKKNPEFEFGNVYHKGQKAAQVLNDAVDIEYYVSANPDNLENIKDKLYIGTIDWYEMTPEARAEYLHNFAERLRTEAKAKGQEYSNTHSFKKGLVEK